MLILAREARGWTQTHLAAAVGVGQPKISRHESGLMPILKHDADCYATVLEVDVGLLLQDHHVLRLGSTFLFNRKRAHVPAKVQRRVQADINIRRMQVDRLLRSVERKHEHLFPKIILSDDDFRGRPQAAANYLRRQWRVPTGPIANLTQIVEHFGGVVIAMDFGTTLIDATHIWEPGLPPMFFMNETVPGDRFRFTLAHEVGHTLMHHVEITNDPEGEADSFASQLLMPRREIRHDLAGLTMERALRLKKVWGVSIQALIRRAFDLKQITKSKYRRMMTALSAGGARTEEPMPIPRESATVMDKLIALHKSDLGYTDDEIDKMLLVKELGPIPPKVRPPMRLVGLFDQSS